MKPLEHAERSVRRYGGTVEDYLDIHEFLDQTKAAHADMRHRAILHNGMGTFIVSQALGEIRTVDGKAVSVRQVAEDHIIEDMGRLPNVSEFISLIPESEAARFAYLPKSRRTIRVVD